MRDADNLLPVGNPHWRKINRPPDPGDDGPGWTWFTAEMLESHAFRALTHPAHTVLMRILVEHLHHRGQENGDLPVTFDDFEQYGVRRKSIPAAIDLAVALGWIDIAVHGRGGAVGAAWYATRYRLTWWPMRDNLASVKGGIFL